MNIRIKRSSMFGQKRKLKKLGFKIKYDWKWEVYILIPPSNIELKKDAFVYFINNNKGENLGHITGDPFQKKGGVLFLTNQQ